MPRCSRQKLEAKIQLREAAQTEQIDLEQAEIFYVFLIPLNNRALRHGGVLDRHYVVYRLMAEQKTTRMNRQMARKV